MGVDLTFTAKALCCPVSDQSLESYHLLKPLSFFYSLLVFSMHLTLQWKTKSHLQSEDVSFAFLQVGNKFPSTAPCFLSNL